jgi:transcriptional regulator with XRE-family HTH domain
MARAGLGLSIADLGKLAGVRTMTISKFERGGAVVPATVEKLRQCFVRWGVEFINGGKSVGVRVPRAD